ncbi:MAG: TRAP transporter TatT component family protein [Pseudomonadota bacterium]
MSPLVCCLFLLASVDAGHGGDASGPTPATALTETLARIDALHGRRDDGSALKEERQLVDATVARAGRDYGVLWRAARLYFWLSDDPSLSNDQRSSMGKIGWDLAERAIGVDPALAPAYYWAAVNMGSFALGLGVVKALTMGMEGKFKGRLQRAGELAPTYQFGGVDVAWGRFYEKLPWPKRDRKKAEDHLRKAMTHANGYNLRARVFLAETLAEDDRAAEAKRLLDEVAAAPVGRYDAPEERRAKALGVGLMPSVLRRLK